MGSLTQPLSELYAPIRDDLAVVHRIFDDELAGDIRFVNDLCKTVSSYRGKMLRPALLLLCGKATGRLSAAHHRLAAVVEMVHMATLIHDDVLDEADERRRRATVRVTAGNVAAVLLGDYLISHAFHLCSGLDSQYASLRIGATTNTVCEGELLQNDECRRLELSEEEYLEIIERKTGALTAVACELGAHFAGASAVQVDAARAYGLSAGVAFQIIDDVLDIVGDPGQIGKTLGLDLRLGKPTLATIHCMANASPSTASALRAALLGEEAYEHAQLCAWLGDTDSVAYAVSVAAGFVRQAIRQLDSLSPTEARSSLVAMAEFILRRSF